MPTNRETLLCRYHYDPLDRLVACTLSEQASTQRFYLKTRLATEIQGSVQRSIFQHDDQLLAQQQRQSGTVETTLLATDQQRSVLNALDATQPQPLAYTPYGHRVLDGGLLSLLGFNGERPDPATGLYLLGNGYRAFNPVLMRFNSPDSWSPFGEGGLNAYAYCVGDPVNRADPTGHVGNPFKGFLNLIGLRTPSSRMTRVNQAYEAATAAPVRTPISQATSAVPDGPPPYSRSETHLELPPPYSPSDGVMPLSARSTSEPNLAPPPPYSGNHPPVLSLHQQTGLQHKLNQHSAHLQRVEDNTRHLESVPPTIQTTIDSLTNEINGYRGALGLPPLYSRNRQVRESL